MLVPFTLEPEALTCGADGWEMDDFHEWILQAWEEQGLLVHDGESLWEKVETLPDRLKKRWHAARRRFPQEMAMVRPNWLDPGQCRELARAVRVIGVDRSKAHQLGLSPEKPSNRPGPTDLEYCVVTRLPRSESFQANAALRAAPLERNQAIEEVWDGRFALLVRRSNRIEIFDRYGATNLVTQPPIGLRSFLKQLDRHPPARVVTLIASIEKAGVTPEQVDGALRTLMDELSGTGILEIQVYLSSDRKAWTERGHDRFLVFKDAVIELGAGLGAFGKDKVIKRTSFRAVPAHGAFVSRSGVSERTILTYEDLIQQFQAKLEPEIYRPRDRTSRESIRLDPL